MSIFTTGGTQLASIAFAGVLLVQAAPIWAHGITERVSLGLGGVLGNGSSLQAAISADGRFVAFASDASNLVPSDSNSECDLFVRDRQRGTTRRVSLGPDDVQGNGFSCYVPAISADGRFIAFASDASNLVPGDTNGFDDVFVRDRWTGTTRRVNLGPNGIQGNNTSRFQPPAISADGRIIAFSSWASNLMPTDTNSASDVFVRDRQRGTTRRVSLGTGGVQGNDSSFGQAISADGRFVAFTSGASNLVTGDSNNEWDVFVSDRQTGTTRRVSVGPSDVQGNGSSYDPAISADGRFVAFASNASNLVAGDTNSDYDVFVHDRQTGKTHRVSVGPGGVQANGSSGYAPAISPDGRFVAFASDASNLVRGDTNSVLDVFVRDRQTGTTRRMSLGPGGVQGNRSSYDPAISADGRFVAFNTYATNLVSGGTKGLSDVYVRIPAP